MRLTGIAIAAALATLAACGPPDQADKNASASASPATQEVAAASASPAATPTPASSPSPKPSPGLSALPSAAPKAVAPGPLASVAPATAPSSIPVTTATASADVPSVAADAPPQIVNVAISKTTVSGGDTVSGEVLTSTNVASVELRIAGFSMSMPKTKPGHFALSYQVPNVPFFFHKTYDMNVIARNTRGDAAKTSVPITIR